MRQIILFSVAIVALQLQSCRLDNFLFNPTETEEYLLEDFSDDGQKFVLDDQYDIDPSKIELMTLASGDETIYAVYLGDKARISQDTVILYCHGNAGNLDWYWERAKLLANAGGKNRFGVLMMDYRGYGKSTGTSTEASLYDDVDVCMEWLKGMGLTDDRLIAYGFSLGSAPCTELTATPRSMQPSKLILEAPFASFDYVTQQITKVSMPGSFYGNLTIDNSEEIKEVEEPFMWLHGEEDAFTAIENGELIVQNYQGRHLVAKRVPGGEHSTVPPTMGLEIYMQLIADFITGDV